jgi:DNA polymerase III sliding clamp (beta) subunit (PCNA family)
MQDTIQQDVFGEPITEQYQIKTTGRVIRPWKQLITQIVKGTKHAEFRVHFTSDGLEVRAVDPANVIAIDVTLHADALDEYKHEDELAIGVSNKILGGVLQHARYGKRTDDPINLVGGDRQLTSIVNRELAGVDTIFRERQALIDADSVRIDFDSPDLDLQTKVDIPTQAFIEVVDAIDSDHATLSADGVLSVHGETDVAESDIELAVPVTGTVEEVLYSHSYLERIAKAMHVGKVDDEITLRFDDEFPMYVDFARDDLYSGKIMIAPRLKSD